MRHVFERLKNSSEGPIAQYLVRGISGSFAVQAAGLVLASMAAIALARIMGATNYGHYSYVLAWIEVLKIPVAYGSPILLQREVAVYMARSEWGLLRGALTRFTQFIILGSLVIGVVTFIVAGSPYLDFFDATYELNALYIGLITLPIAALSAARAGALSGLRQVIRSAIPDQIVKPTVSLLLILALWLASGNMHPSTAMAVQFAATLAAFLCGAYFLWMGIPAEVRRASAEYSDKIWFNAMKPFLLHGGAYVVWSSLGVLMLGWLRSPDEVGIYRAAALMATMSAFPTTAFVVTVTPLVARLFAEKDFHRIQRVVSTTTIALFAWNLMVFLGFLVLGPYIIGMLFGPEFKAGYAALVILSAGNLLISAIWSVAVLLDMSGNQRFPAFAYLGAVGLNLTLGCALIPMAGMEGAAIATAVSWFLVHLFLARIVFTRFGINPSVLAGRPL